MIRRTHLPVLVTVILCSYFLAFGETTKESKAAPVDLKKGGEVYKARCVACHMKDGNAPTKKMRLSDKDWIHGNTLDDVQKVVAEGVKGTVMMGFKNRLSKDDIRNVSAFVLKFSEASSAQAQKP